MTEAFAIGRHLVGPGEPVYVIGEIGLHRRTFGAVLGQALDQHAWADASGIVRALDRYWESRGLGEEADVWADRILTASTRPGQDTPTADSRAADLWLYIMGRRRTEEMRIEGDREVAAAWGDLAGRF